MFCIIRDRAFWLANYDFLRIFMNKRIFTLLLAALLLLTASGLLQKAGASGAENRRHSRHNPARLSAGLRPYRRDRPFGFASHLRARLVPARLHADGRADGKNRGRAAGFGERSRFGGFHGGMRSSARRALISQAGSLRSPATRASTPTGGWIPRDFSRQPPPPHGSSARSTRNFPTR